MQDKWHYHYYYHCCYNITCAVGVGDEDFLLRDLQRLLRKLVDTFLCDEAFCKGNIKSIAHSLGQTK